MVCLVYLFHSYLLICIEEEGRGDSRRPLSNKKLEVVGHAAQVADSKKRQEGPLLEMSNLNIYFLVQCFRYM